MDGVYGAGSGVWHTLTGLGYDWIGMVGWAVLSRRSCGDEGACCVL